MEKSKDELLTGISGLKPTEPFPDEIFYQIFEIEDSIERTQYIESLRKTARQLKRVTEFNNLYKSFVLDYAQRQKQTGQRTQFTDQPLELVCGEWTANDLGVRTIRYDKNAMPVPFQACSHPILPTEILKNVDTAEERITLAYFKSAAWQSITVDRSVCANTNKIVDALSQYGIEVTSDNAKNMVRYISDCVGLNPLTLNPLRSINRLGWVGSSFTPYADDIRYEGDPDEKRLEISHVKRYLQSSLDVDVAERAYQQVLNWVAKNPVRFEDPKADNSPNKGEVWGKIDGEIMIINRDVLLGFLDQNGFDYTAVSKKWSEKGYLIRNSQGKMVHQTKVYGIKSSYIKFKLPQDDDETDKDGFIQVNEGQMELPFE